MTAVLYFLAAWILTWGLSSLEYRLDPKKRPRVLKGIN